MRALIERRDFLKAAGAGFFAAMAPRAALATIAADAVFATAYKDRQGGFGVAVLSEDARLLHTVPLPDRGHDITSDPVSGRSVAFARRPGQFAVVFDHRGGSPPQTIAAAPGRHFFGHGVFSPDGRLLYATENDFEAAAGLIGIYDATEGFKRVGEFPTHGMDPHEVLMMPGGRTLAIANGGIETHPDFGRAKLNLATMEPSLVFVDRETGDLVEKHSLAADLHQLSIRHMDIDGSGRVWFGCQYEGPATDRPQLIGTARPGEEGKLVALPADIVGGFRNYIGSVAANRQAGTVAVSSPQGNRLVVIEAKGGKVLSDQAMTEVCGLAPEDAGFMATTGTGAIAPAGRKTESLPGYVWDNHLLRIG
ncbi:DUF1513 domain-containing protein [Mesorhizobium xinjiangense]|uniref:DUF1513 domain-containing protein n=1 Tax=Mesorhizobium xinjiangense TaxID=2678685 RepID=UPI0038B28C83